MTPKRDFIREYVQAVREAGLKTGFYFSLLDWRYKAYWDGPRKNPKGWREFVDYAHAQVKELMTQYGKIDILWYDGGWLSDYWRTSHTDEEIAHVWRSKELNTMVRRLQPDIIINNRSYLPEDFGTPEQNITPEARPWELCDTMGDLWGASPRDLNRKTPREVITRLITCVSKNGNMLLNIGLKSNGSVQGWQAKIMARIGEWMKGHGNAIYGCTGEWQMPFNHAVAPWITTRKRDILYLHLIRYPGKVFGIANIHDYWFESAQILDTGRRLEITHEPTRDIISGLPKRPPDEIATVLKIKMRRKTGNEQKGRRAIALNNIESCERNRYYGSKRN